MKKMVDIDFIKEWVDISEEELMQRLVKDAVGLQEEAEKNKKKAAKEFKKAKKELLEIIKKDSCEIKEISQIYQTQTGKKIKTLTTADKKAVIKVSRSCAGPRAECRDDEAVQRAGKAAHPLLPFILQRV